MVASPDIKKMGVSGAQIFVETATHTRRGVICPALMAGLSLCNVDWTTDHTWRALITRYYRQPLVRIQNDSDRLPDNHAAMMRNYD